MNCYEVILGLAHHGRTIGRTIVNVRAGSRFSAAIEAEKAVNVRYGDTVLPHAMKVNPISEEAFGFIEAA